MRERASRELAKEQGRFNARPGSSPTELSQGMKHEAAKADCAVRNARGLHHLLTSGGDPGYLVPDPQGIGARGYIHGGINQPYAKDLAAELSSQNLCGKRVIPKLDANAKRFLAQALPHIRPEVYGEYPSAINPTAMIVNPTIVKLSLMD